MADREKVIKGLKELRLYFRAMAGFASSEQGQANYIESARIIEDAFALLKAQEPATIEPKRIELADETKAWLDTMDAVEALGNIADICIDWDGYRTANGLGGLVNEIWAYARYCAARILQAQEPSAVHVTAEINYRKIGNCPNCGKPINSGDYPNYCGHCGQAVKWDG